eukprot:INCI529.1.p1 GENE.INCI529.1~~INCI529.1.p1  ORF type:complete len:514 (-),score=67.48 INCI529.1:1737-3278(-)
MRTVSAMLWFGCCSSAAVASASGALSNTAATTATVVEKPNIIFILADDLGYGDISPAGGVNRSRAEIPTPNIQALADSGMQFHRGYSGQVCAPSRCSLMTGRHSGHCTIRGNDGSYSPLQPHDVTVAEVLREHANYTTALFGKWGLGDFNTTGYPLEQGFDVFVGQDSQVACHNWWPVHIQNGTDGSCLLPGNDFGKQGAHCIAANNSQCTWVNDLVTAQAVSFLRAHASQPDPPPFFIYVSTTTPHTGQLAGVSSDWPTPYQYVGPFADKPWPDAQKHFAGAVWAQDQIVGSIVAELKALELSNDTIVFFSGDNGPDNHDFSLFDDPGPFRGKKRSLHEGGIRQTILASWPGHIAPNSRNNGTLFTFWDLLPTAASLAGIDAADLPAHDGVDIVPTLVGQDPHQQENHTYLYWEFCDYQAVDGLLPQQYPGGWVQAVRFDDDAGSPLKEWKAIRTDRDDKVFLYDLHLDISESVDLSDQFPSVVDQARRCEWTLTLHNARHNGMCNADSPSF